MVKQKYLDKAEVLIEALPYIQRFNRKIIVVKYGGSAMVDEQLKRTVIQDVVLLKLVGFKPIIVHGGGKEISRWVSKVGKEPQFINGLRVTDEETMELAEMVLNKVNKELVALVESLGVKAVGVSGKDGNLPFNLGIEKKLVNVHLPYRNRSAVGALELTKDVLVLPVLLCDPTVARTGDLRQPNLRHRLALVSVPALPAAPHHMPRVIPKI